jgi:hypothetical protein
VRTSTYDGKRWAGDGEKKGQTDEKTERELRASPPPLSRSIFLFHPRPVDDAVHLLRPAGAVSQQVLAELLQPRLLSPGGLPQ